MIYVEINNTFILTYILIKSFFYVVFESPLCWGLGIVPRVGWAHVKAS